MDQHGISIEGGFKTSLKRTTGTHLQVQVDIVRRWRFMAFLESGRWFFHGFCWNITMLVATPWKLTAGTQEWRWMVQMIFHCTLGDFKVNHVNFRGCRRYSFNWLFILSIVMLLLRGCSLICWTCFCCFWLLGNCPKVVITPPIPWDRKYPDVATGS